MTTGSVWRFLRMRGSTVEIDLMRYYSRDLEQIVGVLLRTVRSV